MSESDLPLIKAKLFKLINKENNTSLDPAQFDISLPTAYTNPLYPDINTQVRITPLPGTGYQGAVTIYYRRTDFKDLFKLFHYEINPIDAIYLSEIIPELNNAFGIDILRSDYIDVELPAYLVNYPDRQRIATITAQTNSYFYIGSNDIILGPRSEPFIDEGIIYKHYLHISATDPKVSFICLDSTGTPVADFKFLNNVSNIETFAIEHVVQVKNNFYLIGQFKLTYWLDAEIAIDAKTLIISQQGIVVGHADTPVFTNTKLVATINQDYFYTIDESNASQPNCVYKYNSNGQLVDYRAAVGYVPSLLAVDQLDRLYAVSQPYEGNDPHIADTISKLVRIDRLLANGELDPSFTTIYFKASNPNYYPLRIMDLVFTNTDGFYLAIEPTYGVDIGYIYPVVNNVPVVTNTNGATTYSWNPILRFHSNGDWDINFKPVLKSQLDKTIYIQPGPHLVCSTLHLNHLADTDRIVWFTYRTNPATGFNHLQPISFDYRGNLILDQLANYYQHPKWLILNHTQSQSNKKIIAHGSMQFITTEGEYSDPHYAMVVYQADTQIDRVIYQSRVTPILNSYLVEKHV